LKSPARATEDFTKNLTELCCGVTLKTGTCDRTDGASEAIRKPKMGRYLIFMEELPFRELV
jgi:hypothetical protein